MSRRSASALATSLASVAVALVIGALSAQAYGGESVGSDVLVLPAVVAFPIVGALIARRQPHNAIGWLFLAMGLMTVIGLAADSWFESDLPGSAWAATLGELVLSGLLGLPFVLLLFPSGTLLSPRWQWAFWVAVGASVTISFGVLFSPSLTEYPGVRNPLGIEAIRGTPLDQGGIGWALLLVALVASAVSLVLRYRRADGEERQQLKWLAWSAALIGIGWLLLEATYSKGGPETPAAWLSQIPFIVGFLSLPIMVGVAILRYRLYGIDVVIKKTVIFGILVVLLMAVGVVAALAIGTPLIDHAADRPEMILLAGVVFGLLVLPLYRLSTTIAERLVFRRRADPHEVLRTFAARVGESYSSEDVLPRMARILSEATRATRARVWVLIGDELRVGASWPREPATQRARLDAGAIPPTLDDHATPVHHQGELLGAISVAMPANDPMSDAKAELVEGLALQAGLVLRNVRLIEELRESRRRIVATQDERAKKLERDIHDGAQQRLVALAVKQRLAASLIGRDDERLGAMLDELQHDTKEALEVLRDLARGIYPPLLADKGLATALSSQTAKSAVPVTVDADGVGRFPQGVEAAVYFSVLEALQNAAKYANATDIRVTLMQSDSSLGFEVMDDGDGFDPATATGGSGLRGMADRINAVGGELRVESAPGTGTRVSGHIPVVDTPGGATR